MHTVTVEPTGIYSHWAPLLVAHRYLFEEDLYVNANALTRPSLRPTMQRFEQAIFIGFHENGQHNFIGTPKGKKEMYAFTINARSLSLRLVSELPYDRRP